jgi:hypothetical protein
MANLALLDREIQRLEEYRDNYRMRANRLDEDLARFKSISRYLADSTLLDETKAKRDRAFADAREFDKELAWMNLLREILKDDDE